MDTNTAVQEIEQDLTTDESLITSLSEHKVDGLKLEPFSLLRQAIAADLCDYGSGTFFNAIMTVWVCTLSPDKALEAHSDTIRAKKEAFEWAEKQGYSLWNWKPIIETYHRLNREWASVAKARIKSDEIDGQDEVPNDGGQLES